jgi:ribonuclease P protein component
VISKKVAKGSVTRHALKRRIIAALQALSLPQALIVYPRASAVELSVATLQQELATLLAKRRVHQHEGAK